MASYGAKIKYRQDMAPPGGYAGFYFDRTFAKVWATGWKLYGISVAVWLYSYWVYSHERKRWLRNDLELHDSKCALSPFFLAERDRHWLRFLRYQRDVETEVMKDVPGWKTGTWYGEPLYFTLGERWRDPDISEKYAHARKRDIESTWDWHRHQGQYTGPMWYDKYLPEIVNDWFC